MWSQQQDKVSEHVATLGSMAFPFFMIQGRQSALIDAGVTALLPLFEKLFGPSGLRPEWVLLTHSHYDHVGGLGILRRRVPGIRAAASRLAAEVLRREKVVSYIVEMNRKDHKNYGFEGPDAGELLSAADLRIERELLDGDILDLGGGVSVSAHDAPGHTKDSMCFLVQPDGVLFGGEALGSYVGPDEVQAQFSSSLADYLASLRRLSALPFHAIALPHHGLLTGEDARRHFAVAIRCAEEFRDRVLALAGQGRNPAAIADTIEPELRHGLAELQPRHAFRVNLEAMIRVVLREAGAPA